MSLKSLACFLPDAFNRIDRSHTLEDINSINNIENVFSREFRGISCAKFEYKRGVVTVFSYSQTLKQEIFLNKRELITKIKDKNPNIKIVDIQFKGPR